MLIATNSRWNNNKGSNHQIGCLKLSFYWWLKHIIIFLNNELEWTEIRSLMTTEKPLKAPFKTPLSSPLGIMHENYKDVLKFWMKEKTTIWIYSGMWINCAHRSHSTTTKTACANQVNGNNMDCIRFFLPLNMKCSHSKADDFVYVEHIIFSFAIVFELDKINVSVIITIQEMDDTER